MSDDRLLTEEELKSLIADEDQEFAPCSLKPFIKAQATKTANYFNSAVIPAKVDEVHKKWSKELVTAKADMRDYYINTAIPAAVKEAEQTIIDFIETDFTCAFDDGTCPYKDDCECYRWTDDCILWRGFKETHGTHQQLKSTRGIV
jgi:hypothetical protein